MTTCTYTFAGPDGDKITITGKNALKAYLANGGLAHLLPQRAEPFIFGVTNREPSYSVAADGTVTAEFGPVTEAYRDDPAGAIKQLMKQKTGEAIINHPTLGEISLIYGDGTMGLSHIAERRGQEFMSRLPGLLMDRNIYGKENQTGRVFVGNEANEATIRLDWNGEAKAWLVSAYEKYPDLTSAETVKASTRSDTISQRTGGLTTEGLRDAVAKGVLKPVIDTMIDNGVLVLHRTVKTLPDAAARKKRGVQAIFTPDGKIHMVAASLTADNAQAVLFHELFHKGGERFIGSEQWSSLMGRGASLYRQGEQSSGKTREFFDKARARVADAKRRGAVATGMEVEEFLAYAIEEYESAPAAIRKWVDDFIGALKAWMLKTFGTQIGDVTPAQLAAMAKMALMDVAADRRGEMWGTLGTVFSVERQNRHSAGWYFSDGSHEIEINGAKISYEVMGSVVEIRNIFVRQSNRKNGVGGNALAEFIKNSDENGMTITLFPNPTASGGLSKNRLEQFYAKRGFDNVQNSNRMTRKPPVYSEPRYSVTEGRAEAVIDEAQDALDAPKAKDDYIGGVVGDISLGARLIVHPRTVAAVHKEFTPVYRTAISQMETRDKIIAEFGADVQAYHDLDQAGKENVNKVMELGRLTSQVYTADELRNGVGNPGEKSVVVMVDGKPQITKQPITALLTEVGEVVKLTDDEIAAYTNLRQMFDKALDRLRDQTLEELGYEQFAGQKNAAKAIMDTITDATPAEQAERLRNIAAFVGEIEQAKRAGYVPFARYGDYVVTVKEKVADVTFLDDVDGYLIAQGLPDSFAPDLMEMSAEQTKEGWRIKASQRQAVERLTEKTIYSTKVELNLRDKFDERRAGKVDEIPAVKDAIEKARAEFVGDDPSRRIVAFKVREKKSETPVRLSDVDALAEVSAIDNATWDAIRDKLADAIKAKGFRRHFFHSDNVPGYTGDFERSVADYVIGMGGYLSRRQHMKRWDNAVTAIGSKPKLFEYASKYRNYVNDPQEELALVRQIGFFSYISGVVASAFANLTQVPLMTVPTLAQVAPMPLVLKETARAYKDASMMLSTGVGLDMFDPDKAPEDVRGILKEAWAEGSFIPLETLDLMMTARQRNVGARKGVKAFNTTTQVTSLAFTFAERMNRLVTFIAAARLADKRAVQENAKSVLSGDALARQEVLRDWNAKSFAEWAVDESQYRMGKANRPTVMRGVGASILQFKGFMLQTFEAWYRMSQLHGRDGKFAAAASILALGSLAGVWGLPGADDLRKLIENIYKTITDKDLDLKTELRAWIARTSGSNALAQIVSKGVTYPLGIDLTRVGMGTVAPDSPLAAAGIPFDMLVGRPKRAFEKGSAGDYLGAVGEFTPNFIKHWLVSGSWALEGVRDKRGNLILRPEDLDSSDFVKKALGFQPSTVTDIRDYEYAQRRQETAVDALKRSYTNKLAKAFYQLETTAEPDKVRDIEDRIAKIYADIDEHNQTVSPEQIIKITNRTLRNKIMREREGVMGTWGKERKAARGAAQELRGVFGLTDQEDD